VSTTYTLIREAAAMLYECGDLPPEEADARLSEWIDASTDKAAALQAVIARSEAEGAFLDGEARAIAAAAKRCDATAARCKGLLVQLLRSQVDLGGPGKVSGPGWSAGLTSSKAVVVLSEGMLPGEYFRVKTTREPDKAAIKEAIEGGAEVPGAALEDRYSATIRRAK
jgi:hypothetical protein